MFPTLPFLIHYSRALKGPLNICNRLAPLKTFVFSVSFNPSLSCAKKQMSERLPISIIFLSGISVN